jgi:antitoxin ParD1/3/4
MTGRQDQVAHDETSNGRDCGRGFFDLRQHGRGHGERFFKHARARFIHKQHDRWAGIWEEGAVKLLSAHSKTKWQQLTKIAIYYKLSLRRPAHTMQTMNISLPDLLKNFVDQQITRGRYSSASEYVRELIREDEKRKAGEQLEALLLEGMQSEESPLTRQDWVDIRKEAMARIKLRKKQGRRK